MKVYDFLKLKGITFEEFKESVSKGEFSYECECDNFIGAYGIHMDYEMGFAKNKDYSCCDFVTYQEFKKELSLGYGNSEHRQIARMFVIEDSEYRGIYYDNEFV